MDEKQRLLEEIAERLRIPIGRIEGTEAWRRFPNCGDSLEVAELVIALEEELRS